MSPPKATFQTRIWHPNVEEKTGSVCVDTLKKDWEPHLTLRHVLLVISCLLIHPNSDSALNSTAGHLLREDYDAFAHQARLMTSIHAGIPPEFRDAVLQAKQRGDIEGMGDRDEVDDRPRIGGKIASASRVTMKQPARLQLLMTDSPMRSASAPVAPPSSGSRDIGHKIHVDEEDLDTKENDPSLSPTPVIIPPPRRPSLAKRPLSDLPTPTEDEALVNRLSPSEQNIAANRPKSCEDATASNNRTRESHTLVEMAQASSVSQADPREGDPPAKRIRSDEFKENVGAAYDASMAGTLSIIPSATNLPIMTQPVRTETGGSSKMMKAKLGKARVGLRRL